MSSVALYEISEMRNVLDQWLDESEGEVTPELEQLMTELDAKADEKIERVALYIRERLARAGAVKEEVQRIQAIQKREEKAAESLKAYLHREMDRLGKTKVSGLLCTVALQNNPPSVKGEIDADGLLNLYTAGLPYVRHVPASYVLDRRAVLDMHKSGGVIPPALTVEQSQSLRIR
jgi:hypothetical protein